MTPPKYSRRHYEDVAEILKGAYQVTPIKRWSAVEYIQLTFEDLFRGDNPRFDLERFRKAAEGE